MTSIQQLMRATIAGNPGLEIGPEWIDRSVREIAGIDFGHYCHSTGSGFLLELQALFILRAKGGGGREFWLADETSLLFAYSLCCHQIQWLGSLEQLRDRANHFILRMRRDTPFWETYPLSDRVTVEPRSNDDCPIALELSKLPLLSRLHFLYFAQRGNASLMRSNTYNMRSLGLNPLETAPILQGSGLLEMASDPQSLASVVSKDDLVLALDERRIPYKKTWKKSDLLDALALHAPDLLTQFAKREGTARIKEALLPQTRALVSYANALEVPLKLLCFATAAN